MSAVQKAINGMLLSIFCLSGCRAAVTTSLPTTTIRATATAAHPQPTNTPQVPDPTGKPADSMDALNIRPIDGMAMILVLGGSFPMGSTDVQVEDALALCREYYNPCNRWYYERESPQHQVTLDDFYLDQTEVSNAEYRLCVEAGVCAEPTHCKKGEPTYADLNLFDHPVVCAGWEDAQTYCNWVGGRLPTEAEWEYAARGQAGLIYPWGNEFDGSRLNYCDANCSQSHADLRFDDGYAKTAPVGSTPEDLSWGGFRNLGGNVSEWTADWQGEHSEQAVSNPVGPESGREKIIKGCSWTFPAVYCRGASRGSADPGLRLDYLGFRCARSVGGD